MKIFTRCPHHILILCRVASVAKDGAHCSEILSVCFSYLELHFLRCNLYKWDFKKQSFDDVTRRCYMQCYMQRLALGPKTIPRCNVSRNKMPITAWPCRFTAGRVSLKSS